MPVTSPNSPPRLAPRTDQPLEALAFARVWHMIATATTTGTVAAGWPGSSGSAVRHAHADGVVTTITAGGATGGGGAPGCHAMWVNRAVVPSSRPSATASS